MTVGVEVSAFEEPLPGEAAAPPRRGRGRSLAGSAYSGRLSSSSPSCSHELGSFIVAWSLPKLCLLVVHRDRPKEIIWSSVPGWSFLTAAVGDADVADKRGFFKVRESLASLLRDQVVEGFTTDGESLTVVGSFADAASGRWEVVFKDTEQQQLQLSATASLGGEACNRLCLAGASHADEGFFGFGCQMTRLNMKGRRVPILCQEKGIGRGIQPLTCVMECLFGASGAWWQTYSSVPVCLSTDLRGCCLENTEYSVFDFTEDAVMRVGTFSEALKLRVFGGARPLDLLEAYTSFSGRMRTLPEWVHAGAIIGAQGGTVAVKAKLAKLEAQKVPISGLWMQDWVGRRKTAVGSQLWWNWELNREHYPQWEQLVEEQSKKGVRILTYINPFLVDASADRSLRRDLHAEATEKGYFIKTANGKPYPIDNTTFSASMIDLSNEGCRRWIKDVIKDEVIGAGASGWMLDYGEALPFEARLAGGMPATAYHNQYPVEWAKVAREAVQEAGLEHDALFFTRSAFTQSPAHSTASWTGDHLTSWRQEDGIKSAVVSLVSSGLSGMTLNHTDIGGYTSTKVLPFYLPGITYTRSQELLMRWVEFCAFTAVFRTHEGVAPDANHQVWDNAETTAHFAKFARVYAALTEYRSKLCDEAAARGAPLVRHPWLHYPEDPVARQLELQFMFGEDFMVAPVLDPGVQEGSTYLPVGAWTHLWTGEEVTVKGLGRRVSCHAPLGFPPVYFVTGSAAGAALRVQLASSGDLEDGGALAPRSGGSRWRCCARRRRTQVHPAPAAEAPARPEAAGEELV